MNLAYRRCIVAVITRDYETFLVGERSNIQGVWQFPQGGVDEGESDEQALFRELKEEIGTNDAQIVQASSKLISYDFPKDLGGGITKKFRGQAQRWYLLELASGAMPNLEISDGEFSNVEFRKIPAIVAGVIDWKKTAYFEGLSSLGLWQG